MKSRRLFAVLAGTGVALDRVAASGAADESPAFALQRAAYRLAGEEQLLVAQTVEPRPVGCRHILCMCRDLGAVFLATLSR